MKITPNSFRFLGTLLGTTLLFSACETTDDSAPKGAYEKGVFVTNEGNFNSPTGEVSYYDPATKIVIPQLFNQVNNRPLGDVVQSMTIADEKAFLVANNSNKIEVVDANTFVSLGVIEGLQLPRYMAVVNSQKGYVTEWLNTANNLAGRVTVLDLTTNTVASTIAVGKTPEALLLHNSKLYVANSGENTISIINTTTDQVEKTVTVPNGPNSFAVDAAGQIWVICGRTFYNPDYSVDNTRTTVGHLVKFNPATPENQTRLSFPSAASQPRNLTINGAKNQLYYQYSGGVYSLSTSAASLSATPLLKRSGLYGLGVDPRENILYVGAGAYNSNGRVIRFSPSGMALDSFQVMVLPNGFTFR